jgi:hypothetical protein
MKFKTTLLQAGKTATGFTIPSEIVEGLGAGKKPPVRITINGYTYRNTVAVMGGKYMVGVSAEHRMGAHVAGGDKMEVTIELDTEPGWWKFHRIFKRHSGKTLPQKNTLIPFHLAKRKES